jgi:phosphoribosylanthranilate isomerase
VSAVLPIRADGLPLIKMCGLRRASDVTAAKEAGADLIGMIFAPSRRRISVDEARAVLDEVSSHPPLVGVFVNETVETMGEIVHALELSFIQLSGDEAPDSVGPLEAQYIKVIHLREGGAADEALRRMDLWKNAGAFLLDSWSPQGGGSGTTADWEVAADIVRRAPGPVLLAGGLHPENVGAAIKQTTPWGVDVSSGLEQGGWKDSTRMKAFAAAVRNGGKS